MLLAGILTALAVFLALLLRRAWKYLWDETDAIRDVFELDDPKDYH